MRSGFLLRSPPPSSSSSSSNSNIIKEEQSNTDDNNNMTSSSLSQNQYGPLRDARSITNNFYNNRGGRSWGMTSDTLGTASKAWSKPDIVKTKEELSSSSNPWTNSTSATSSWTTPPIREVPSVNSDNHSRWISSTAASQAVNSSIRKSPLIPNNHPPAPAATTNNSSLNAAMAEVNVNSRQNDPTPQNYNLNTANVAIGRVDDGSLSTSTTKSPFHNIPFLPKTLGEPKNAICSWYGKQHKRVVPKTCFNTWSDGGKAHVRLFTSIFTCPVTGERFASGEFGSMECVRRQEPAVTTHNTVELCYYSKKMMAEHAAAARALDCLSYREHCGHMTYGLCREKPYLNREECFILPLSATSSTLDEQPRTNKKQKKDNNSDHSTLQQQQPYQMKQQSDNSVLKWDVDTAAQPIHNLDDNAFHQNNSLGVIGDARSRNLNHGLVNRNIHNQYSRNDFS